MAARWSDELAKKFLFSKEKQVGAKKHKRSEKNPSEPKENKYKAIRTASGFPSQLEEAVYAELLYLQKAGKLRDVSRYPSVHLAGNLRWKCDFIAYDLTLNQTVYIEAKGFEDARFNAIKQVWPALGPGLMRIYKGKNGRVFIEKEIKGKE